MGRLQIIPSRIAAEILAWLVLQDSDALGLSSGFSLGSMLLPRGHVLVITHKVSTEGLGPNLGHPLACDDFATRQTDIGVMYRVCSFVSY
jgi:hypothetical protein